jgi:hypothetical protein
MFSWLRSARRLRSVDAGECECEIVSEDTFGRDAVVGADAAAIVCTLTAADLPARRVEWQEFYRTSVTELEQATPVTVRLRLAGTDESLLAAASLAQREKECCAFFEFAIVLEPTEKWLTISVPIGAEEVLTDFVGMLRR